MSAQDSKSVPPVEALRGLRDVTEMTAPAGQVLVYPGHYPNGVYVLLEGAVELRDGHSEPPLRLEPGEVPLVMPPLDELDQPSRLCAATIADSRLLFVPRTLALGSKGVAALLSGDGLSPHSLQGIKNPTRHE